MIYELTEGNHLQILTTGSISSFVYEAYNLLEKDFKDKVGIYGINKISPLRLDSVKEVLYAAKRILVIEEGIENGFYSQFLINYPELASKSSSICHPKKYLKCGNYKYMLEQANLDEISILNTMKQILE